MYSIRSSDPEPESLWATRGRLYVGAGLCAGSALGVGGAALADLPVALALFGGAVPVLALQVRREYRLLRRHRRSVDAPREALN